MDLESQLGTEYDANMEITPVSSTSPVVEDSADDEGVGEVGAVETQAELTQKDEGEVEDSGIDLDAPQFSYVDDAGNEVQLTGRDIIELIKSRQAAGVAEKGDEPAESGLEEGKAEEQLETQPGDLPFDIVPIDLKKVGSDVVSMLSGENGGEEALGPAIAEFQFQTFVQDPRFAFVLNRAVETILERRESRVKEEESFKQFVGKKVDRQMLQEFQKTNPWAKTEREALLALQLNEIKKELDSLRSSAGEQANKAKLEGEMQAIKNLKAKGTLRAIGGRTVSQSQAKDLVEEIKSKYDITDPQQRSLAMAEAIMRRRGMM